ASSKIEGLRVSPQQVALAELASTEVSVKSGFTTNAALVANNITALRQAATELAQADVIDIAAVNRLHRALLPTERHQGLRTVQNWIGGNDWNPIDAEFVPPPPERVPALMADLCDYLSGSVHGPLVQAAMAHAQFETIHPYADGNGRVGRALIHTVLVRRGLTPAALLPISLVFLTRSREYIGGLNSYRHVGAPGGAAARDRVSKWLSLAFDAAVIAAQQAELFSDNIATLTDQWHDRLADYRTSQGRRALPRADSAQAKLVEILPELPVATARTTQRALGVSFPAARAALEELAEARILRRKQVDRGTTGYLATEVFDLLTF
ncbi:MAG: Fic family protein, partial [Pseudonocardiaceae bacterium]|nr:Fic family protein [Pseudonocardiaceae bacterium]